MNNDPSVTGDVDSAECENPMEKDTGREKTYWNTFYSDVSTIPRVPSQFGALVSTEVNRSIPIVEFGCGNGRDSLYFASQGFRVLASDLCKDAIKKNQEKIKNGDANCRLDFSICDCTDETDVKDLIRRAHEFNNNVVVYHRFFLHSIDQTQEHKFLIALGKNLRNGDKLYMEFRCELDEALPKVYGKGHYRRYVKTNDVINLMKSMGFELEYEMTGQGMAKYKSEDPFVSRVIVVKGSGSANSGNEKLA